MTAHPNPLLDSAGLPAFSRITASDVAPAIDALLNDYRAEVERLVADPAARSFDALMAPLEDQE